MSMVSTIGLRTATSPWASLLQFLVEGVVEQVVVDVPHQVDQALLLRAL